MIKKLPERFIVIVNNYSTYAHFNSCQKRFHRGEVYILMHDLSSTFGYQRKDIYREYDIHNNCTIQYDNSTTYIRFILGLVEQEIILPF